MHKPLPTFSDDPVIDFLVTEAVMAAGIRTRKEEQDRQRREEWKRAPVGSGTPGR